MGVQVGSQYFNNLADAENYLYSQAVPIFTQTGVLAPVFKEGHGWTFEGQDIHPSLPECSQAQNFLNGELLGWTIAFVIVAAWKFKIIQRLL